MQFDQIARHASLAAVIGLTTCAHAAVVDFNDQPDVKTTDFVSDGFHFVIDNPFGIAYTTARQICSPECPVSGSVELIDAYGPSTVTMTSASGATFSLNSFLAAGSFNFGTDGPKTVTVTGQLASGGTVSTYFRISDIGSGDGSGPLPFILETLNSSFAGLTSATFSSSGALYQTFDGLTLDDIAVNVPKAPVPESSSTALMLAGLALVGLLARPRLRPTGRRETALAILSA